MKKLTDKQLDAIREESVIGIIDKGRHDVVPGEILNLASDVKCVVRRVSYMLGADLGSDDYVAVGLDALEGWQQLAEEYTKIEASDIFTLIIFELM